MGCFYGLFFMGDMLLRWKDLIKERWRLYLWIKIGGLIMLALNQVYYLFFFDLPIIFQFAGMFTWLSALFFTHALDADLQQTESKDIFFNSKQIRKK